MKRHIILFTVIFILLLAPIQVLADTIPGAGTGGGGGSGGKPEEHPPYSTYTPKVTIIHNVNAMAASSNSTDNDEVYYIPTLEELPFSLKDYIQNVADKSFAIVYDGSYDAESDLTRNVSEDNGSDVVSYSPQSIATGGISNPALKSIGYDLLLVDDNYTVNKVGTDIVYKNKSTVAGTTALTASQAIMDVYKALGKFEYKVDVAFMKDKNWSTNSSPILSQLSVLTSQSGTNGLNIEQSYAAVAVSRTKPELYWNRFLKDGISSGMDTNIGNGSLSTHASITCSENNYISYMEFLRVLTAIINLYGEDNLSDIDYQNCVINYSAQLGSVSQRSEEDRTIIYYLVAKGILDPSTLGNIDLDGNVYLLSEYNNMSSPKPSNSIIDILGRVADKEKRFTLPKETPNMDEALKQAGYGLSKFYINNDIINYSEQLTSFSTYYDYLIEKSEQNTYVAKVKVTEMGATSSEDVRNDKSEYDAVSNMRLVINGVEKAPLPMTATDAQIDRANAGTLFDNGFSVGTYLYYGLEKHDGKYYYHYKISPDVAKSGAIAFRYSSNPEGEVLVKDKGTFTLPDTEKGGVYNAKPEGGYSYLSFLEANYDDTYVDYNTKVTTPLASDYTTITFYISNKILSKNKLSTFSNDEDSIYNWTALLNDNGKVKYNELINVLKDSAPDKQTNYTCAVVQESDANSDYSRVQIITRNVSGLRSSRLFTSRYNNKEYISEGYYRATDNSLMVSYNTLKEKELVTSLSEVSEGVYVITAGKLNTNIIIYTGNGDNHDGQYLIVGDTMYPNVSETLLVKADGDTYINYRACIGWGGEYAFISEGDDAVVINYGEYGVNSFAVNQEAKPITTFFPTAATKLLYTSVNTRSGANFDSMQFEGFNMTGSYALSPYLIVADENTSEDRLFVWHRNKGKDSDGNKHTIAKEDRAKIKKSFEDRTGIKLGSQKGYILKEFVLYKKDNTDMNPRGISYSSTTAHTPAGDKVITMGWIWNPPEYTDVRDALNDYVKSVDESTELVLPIFAYKPLSTSRVKYYDANVNFSSDSAGSDYLSVGTMPYYVGTADSRKEKKYCTITKSGGYSLSKSAGESTKDYVLSTAPTNIFAQLKGMGKKKVNEITAGSIYFGTSKCVIRNKQVLLNGRTTSFKYDSDAICTYLSNGNSSVYCVSDAQTNIGEILKDIDTNISHALDDPENLVDWGQFKFERLIMNLDAWSTVALIFALNILPRVCMLLFFALMTLSLISDWRPWKRFCNKWFDIYSFLSLGHITVDSVDTKRLVLISLICLSIFVMIMDGQIINFIIFIAKFFVAIYQR